MMQAGAVPGLRATVAVPHGAQRRRATFIFLVLLLGIGARAMQYLHDRSYWHDEASLVLNIRNKTAGQLLGPLDYAQAAPPLFLLAERGLFRALGGSEFALRSLPLAAGIVSVLLFAMLAHRVIGPPWDLLAMLLFGLSEKLVWHTAEVKQYGTDVMTAAALMLLAVGPGAGMSARKRLGLLCAAGMVAVWFSFPAVLVFGALSLALLPEFLRDNRQRIFYLACNLPVGLSFLVVLRLTSHAQHDEELANYWQAEFLDWRHPVGWPGWLLHQTHSLCNYALAPGGPVILAGIIGGCIWLWRTHRRQWLVMFAGPIVLAIAAACAHQYPYDGARLTVFLAPAVLLLAVLGLRWLWEAIPRPAKFWALVPSGYLVAAATVSACVRLFHPQNHGHLRPVAQYLQLHARPSDGIYALERREFEAYWPPDDPRVRFKVDPAGEIPFGRFWIVWSFSTKDGVDRVEPLLRWSGQVGSRTESYASDGGKAVLFERRGGEILPTTPPPDTHSTRKTKDDLKRAKP